MVKNQLPPRVSRRGLQGIGRGAVPGTQPDLPAIVGGESTEAPGPEVSRLNEPSSIKLRDGRTLAYAEYGDPGGSPVFYFHGTPGSRLERHPDESIARDRRARIITIDRPGYGHSDFQPGRTFLDWADDVAQLADALSIERFVACGWSGGTPHALACAFKMPERLTAVGIFSGAAPFDVPGVLQGADLTERAEFAIAHRLPWQLARQMWKPISAVLSRATVNHYDTLLRLMHEPERSELGAPGVSTVLAESIVEAYRQGGQSEAWEDRILAGPWGFAAQDIKIPVSTWHGTADTLAPPAMGRALAASLRHGHTTWYEGEGHGLWFKHWPDMLETLLSPIPATS